MADIQMEEGSAPPSHHEATILAIPEHAFAGFVTFLRERGVAGFAIGFIFGGASQTLVKSCMDDIINPLIAVFLGPVDNVSAYTLGVLKIGDFFSELLNFILLCIVMYLIFKVLHIDRLDKPKS